MVGAEDASAASNADPDSSSGWRRKRRPARRRPPSTGKAPEPPAGAASVRRSGDAVPTAAPRRRWRWLAAGFGLALALLAASMVIGGPQPSYDDERTAGTVALGDEQSIELRPGHYDVALYGPGLWDMRRQRTYDSRRVRTASVREFAAIELPTVLVDGPQPVTVDFEYGTATLGGGGSQLRVAGTIEIPASASYTVTVGTVSDPVDAGRLRGVLLSEHPLIPRSTRNSVAGALLLAGAGGVVVAMIATICLVLAAERRSRWRPFA